MKAVFGCTTKALALYRIALGTILLAELLLRFRFLHAFYTDEGTHPLSVLIPNVDAIYKLMCVHCLSGQLMVQQLLLGLQCAFAFGLAIGYKTRYMAIISWFLYFSLTLRNTWLSFILDRYYHYLLFYAMFLPLDHCWAISICPQRKTNNPGRILSFATVALKLQVTWIYLDAGLGKYNDPLGGWTYSADPLPALDTYTRHTLGASYLYALLKPQGLRLLTPTVVYVELLSAPVAFLASYFGWNRIVNVVVAIICSLHIGIAITVWNTVLLSLAACVSWIVFLPLQHQPIASTTNKNPFEPSGGKRWHYCYQALFILPFVFGSIWLDTMSIQCSSGHQAMTHIWSTLLHNRWNVFTGAEEYVTWEIAPGRLADGSIVDVWGRFSTNVDWNMPKSSGSSTTRTTTYDARPGRWRSFPYLGEMGNEEHNALWNYLCYQWDVEHDVVNHPERKLLRFNFFMLQADILPNMGFSSTRKRLIQEFVCDDDMVGTGMAGNEKDSIRVAREAPSISDSTIENDVDITNDKMMKDQQRETGESRSNVEL